LTHQFALQLPAGLASKADVPLMICKKALEEFCEKWSQQHLPPTCDGEEKLNNGSINNTVLK
jgi:hypothetical protein